MLAVDEEYRAGAEQSRLPTIAPRRFNPDQEPWLPVYQTRKDGWRFRALFSNTALAHRLNQTRDWVVIYFDDGFSSGQRTIVTETRGDLRGRRVVRGREFECREQYRMETESPGPASTPPHSEPHPVPEVVDTQPLSAEDSRGPELVEHPVSS
jgi:hypothetical protein